MEETLRDLHIPLRIWLIAALILLVAGAGVLALTWLAPRSDTTLAQAEPPLAQPEVAAPAAVNQPDPAPAPEGPPLFVAPQPAGAQAGPDGVVRMDIPFAVPAGPEPDAGFQARIVAFAEEQQARLPTVDGLATLETVDVEGRVITYHYRVDVNLRLYTLPNHQIPLLPLLDGWLCDGSVCFEFHHEEFALDRCESDVYALIADGAVAVYEYRDMNGLPMATRAISLADCAAALTPNPGR